VAAVLSRSLGSTRAREDTRLYTRRGTIAAATPQRVGAVVVRVRGMLTATTMTSQATRLPPQELGQSAVSLAAKLGPRSVSHRGVGRGCGGQRVRALRDGNCIDSPALAGDAAVTVQSPAQYKAGAPKESHRGLDKAA
jgi:hypothetical protein